MDEELYDPQCSACERAQADYADLEREADNLVALVLRLARALRKAAPADESYDLPLAVTWLCVEHHKEIHWPTMKEAA